MMTKRIGLEERRQILLVAMDAEMSGKPDEAAALRATLGWIHPLEEIVGKTMESVTKQGSDSIEFRATTGERWIMEHKSDCCESVYIEDVVGDLSDLVGSPIFKAEEDSSTENPLSDSDESFTWTFYHFATVKGYVTVRWYGSSNGYYSETAEMYRL